MLLFGILILSFVLGGSFLMQHLTQTPQKTTESERKNTPAKVVHQVQITKDGFVPETVTIQSNDIVVLHNVDTRQHVVVSEIAGNNMPGVFNTGGLDQNQKYQIKTYTKPGTYKYFREANYEQKGTVIVR
jgi:plastocyanin